MKCPACGREMLNKGKYFDCPNVLCDYFEEIENKEVRATKLLIEHVNPIMAHAIKQ